MVSTIDCASLSESSYDGRELDRQAVLRLRDERVELLAELGNLAGAALLGREAHEVADELVGIGGELPEHRGLAGRVDLRVAQERAQLGHVVHRRASAPRSAETASTRPASCAASKSARAYMRCATAIRLPPVTSPRSCRRKASQARTQGAFVLIKYGCDRGRRLAQVCSRQGPG